MAWQPNWNVEEMNALVERVGELKNELDSEITRHGDTPKWEYPVRTMEMIRQMRDLREAHQKLLRNDLAKLLEWPSALMSHPAYFYESSPGTENFPRSENWFEQIGFHQYHTTYSFSNRWDRAKFDVAFYVPDDLKAGANVPVMWFFHGGGFCTGANDHIPWFGAPSMLHARKRGAIIIAPDYPLGPEGNYADICDSIRDFLRWYKEDGYFKDEKDDSESNSWQEWIIKKINKKDITIDKDRVFVEGESAGGHAAVMALWINAANDGPKLSVKSCLLRYPMLVHYARDFPPENENNGMVIYMGEKFTQTDVTQRAKDIVAAINELEKWGLVPTRSKGYAPQNMSATLLLSITKLWQSVFQRKHGEKIGGPVDPTNPDYMDCLERVDRCVDTVDHDYLPPIAMYHGSKDPNCPIKYTEEFQQILLNKYPVYRRQGALSLREVSYLNWKYSFMKVGEGSSKKRELAWQPMDEVGHAFDYDLDTDREEFLKATYEDIDKVWLSKD